MIGGRLLVRNTALNLLGQFVPLVVAIVAIPVLVRGLGPDRFGILTLAWAIIGYFGFFDFGIGRALTQAAGEAIGRNDTEALSRLSATALPAMFVLGGAGGLLLAGMTHWLIYAVLNVPVALRHEAAESFYVLAISLPFIVMATGYRGLMEAHQHFGLATALRLPFGIFSFVGPLLVLPFSHNAVPVVATLTLGRLASFFMHVFFCVRRYPYLRDGRRGSVGELVPLLRTGGWMTVSNVISPIMVNMDRFIIGALLTIGAVAFYTVPFDAVSKLLVVPGAVMGVFFPAFASTYRRDPATTAGLFDRSTRMIVLSAFPALLIAAVFARPILTLWVGPTYAAESTRVLQWLTVGMFITCLAHVPFALLQAVDRPDLTAKLHMLELPLYVGLIVALTRLFGITGVAIAFTVRVALDLAALYWLCARVVGASRSVVRRSTIFLGAGVVILSCATIPALPVGQIVFAVVTLAVFFVCGWHWLLAPSERQLVIRLLPWGGVVDGIAAPPASPD